MVSIGELYDETKRIFFELIMSENFYIFILLICFLIYTAYRIYYKSYIEPKIIIIRQIVNILRIEMKK